MSGVLTTCAKVDFGRKRHGRKVLSTDAAPPTTPRVPRIARLMALAIRFDGLLRDGAVADQAELARLGHVTRARLTQIMNLLNLAPDIQEELLTLSCVEKGRMPITERCLRPIAAEPDWQVQRRMWEWLCREAFQGEG